MVEKEQGQGAAHPFQWGARTDIGRIRQRNEDVFISEPGIGLFLVADGMGGHAGGDLAARLTAKGLTAAVRAQLSGLQACRPAAVRRRIKGLIAEQSREVHEQGLARNGFEGMGATLAMALFLGGRAYLANLGDSRIYRLRGGRLVQLSRDHTVIRELVEEGEIEAHEAMYHHAKGLITQYVGMPDEPDPHVYSRVVKPGDRFLLCSDGLTDLLADTEIRAIIKAAADCQAACDALVDRANAHGGYDNITVVLAHWLGEPGRPI